VTFIEWLIRGREDRPQPVTELPGDTSRRKLTRPVIMFAALRAVVVAITVAIAWGLHVQYADWMALSALVAMKPSLAESALKAEQRLAGVTIGAALAALFLLTVHNVIALGVIIAVLGGLAVSIIGVNYAWYYAAMTGVVLISLDQPHPSDLADEGRRVLFTFIGVGIAVLVMFLADPARQARTGCGPARRPGWVEPGTTGIAAPMPAACIRVLAGYCGSPPGCPACPGETAGRPCRLPS